MDTPAHTTNSKAPKSKALIITPLVNVISENAEKENKLLDLVMAQHNLARDSDLARFIGIGASQISKIRQGHAPITAETLLLLHDVAGFDIREMKNFLGQPGIALKAK